MISRKILTDHQARDAIVNGEFGEDVIASQKHVVIILTQSWCLEWYYLQQSLDFLDHDKYNIAIFELEYDQVAYYRAFLAFKEDVLGNDLIPYLRYYRDGKLVGQTNYVSIQQFLTVLDLT